MAINAYLTLKGQKTGNIAGSVIQKGREGSIMVIATSHEIVSPRDSASGMASGKRMHKPLVITKELDKSTPLLYQALCNNEKLVTFLLKFWRPAIAGQGVRAPNISTTRLRSPTPPSPRSGRSCPTTRIPS